MIYIDGSVALAQLLFEARLPRASLWREPLVSSRLLEYEVWNRMHAYDLADTRGDDARALLALVDMIDLSSPVLARALDPFPVLLGTLDGLHLSTLDALDPGRTRSVELASYDNRLIAAAQALGIPIAAL